MNNYNRHYYIDLFRGIAFILMVFDHLIFDIVFFFRSMWANLFSKTYYLNVFANFLREYRRSDISRILRITLIVFVFLFISGVCSNFSKKVSKRGLRLFVLSMGITLISFIISLIIQDKSIIIYFGIIHCISICMLLTPLMKKINRVILGVIAIVIIGLGFYFETIRVNTNLLIIFNLIPFGFTTGDYYPLFPFLGFYIFGFIFGEYYFIKLNKPKATKKYNMNIFTYFGKNALVWYFVHQILLVVFLFIFTGINILIYRFIL